MKERKIWSESQICSQKMEGEKFYHSVDVEISGLPEPKKTWQDVAEKQWRRQTQNDFGSTTKQLIYQVTIALTSVI